MISSDTTNLGRNARMISSTMRFSHRAPSEVLSNAAEWVRGQQWVPGVSPQLIDCLISSTGFYLDTRLCTIAGEGWEHRRYRDVYLPRPLIEQYIYFLTTGKATRIGFRKVTGYLEKAVGYDNLTDWCHAYSTGPDDIIDAFERAAELARSKGE